MKTSTSAELPREGMMATVRKRPAVIVRVKPFDSDRGRLHLVDVEYTDVHGGRGGDSVIWEQEREVGAKLVAPGALPEVVSELPMAHPTFDALVRASRWSALTPFLPEEGASDGSGGDSDDLSFGRAELPLASPFHGAVQVEDFQLVPLLKALQMPRISLLLADDVGLGKTIEAGLILMELLLRRRVRRVLVMTPASLRDQWVKEMHDKFALGFDVVDRRETHVLRRRLGLDANPWRTFPRIVTSYHYLRQHDVLQQFVSASKPGENMAQLPWDLLIVDEAHNLMPSPFGADSDLVEMLRSISPLFEHKLFLTATPHNGHTRSFSGLLELLDPVRFNRTLRFTDAEKERVDQVVIRRLKSEINELDDEKGRPRRFAERTPEPLPLYFGKRERAVADAFATFRAAVKKVVARASHGERLAGTFAVEVLQKRLLSSPRTFADSWYRFLAGLRDTEAASQLDLFAARKASEADIDDDREKQDRARHASRTAGAWLKPLAGALADEIAGVTGALRELGLEPGQTGEAPDNDERGTGDEAITRPKDDARFDRLVDLIDKRLCHGKGHGKGKGKSRSKDKATSWREDERLIVFTEYKTTLDDLDARLREHYGDAGSAIRVLYGNMDPGDRKAITGAFNDPEDALRVLVATDTASEGLNLQATARLLLHYDIPWNPSRIEQRNGRLDRHGQARDVTVFHFTSDDDADLRFLGRVVGKVHQIREDLGTLGQIFDAAFQRRFSDLEDGDQVGDAMDDAVERGRGEFSLTRTTETVDEERVRQLCAHIDLSPNTLRSTLEIALGLEMGYPRLEGPDGRGRFRLISPIPARWQDLVDDSLRLPLDAGPLAGALPGLVFDAEHVMVDLEGRRVFRPSRDSVLLHLGHPIFRQALATFARLRFPGADAEAAASRWTVRRGQVPDGSEALIIVVMEELAINALREPFHHWVRVVQIPVDDEELGIDEPYQPSEMSLEPPANSAEFMAQHDRHVLHDRDIGRARELWEPIRAEVLDFLQKRTRTIEDRIAGLLSKGRDQAIRDAEARFDNRIAEIKELMKKQTLARMKREIDVERERYQAQPFLYADMQRAVETRLMEQEQELERRKRLDDRLLDHLGREKKRMIEHLLPARFSLEGGGVQVFPLAIEIRLPEKRR